MNQMAKGVASLATANSISMVQAFVVFKFCCKNSTIREKEESMSSFIWKL